MLRSRSFFLVLSLVFACEDESTPPANASPANVGPDAGTSPQQDGSSPPPPPGNGVVVHVVRLHEPLAGMQVVFHDAAGAVTAVQKTDAEGKVTAATAPSQVTVALPPVMAAEEGDGAYTLITYTGIEDGDVLRVDASPQPPALFDATGPTGYAISLTPAPNAERYLIQTGRYCVADGYVEAPTAVALTPHCVTPKNAILVSAIQDLSQPYISYGWKKDITPPATAADAHTIGNWTAPTQVDLSATNLPASEEVAYQASSIVDEVPFFISGRRDFEDRVALEMPPAAFANVLQLTVAATVDTATRTILSFTRQGPHEPVAFDFAQALPKVLAQNATLPAPHRPESTWTTERPFAGPDAVDGGVIHVGWSVRLNPDTLVSRSWFFVVPPNATSVKAPELPSELLDAFTPATNFDPAEFELVSAVFTEGTQLQTYKDFKSLVQRRSPLVDSVRPLPAAGTFRRTIRGLRLDER